MRNRAQLAVAGALTFAVILIGVALLLNSVIFTENLATRQGPADSAAETYRTDTRAATTSIIEQVNRHNNTTRAGIEENLTDAVAFWSESLAREQATAGIDASVMVSEQTPGTLLLQTNHSRNFSAGGAQAGSGNWTLGDVDGARQVRLNVSRASLYQLGLAGSLTTNDLETASNNAFHVEVEDGGDVWRVYFFTDADNVVRVFVEDPSGNYVGGNDASCQHQADDVTVDLAAGTVAGAECDALSFYPETESHTIRYRNASLGDDDRATGTYRILVEVDSVNQDPYYDHDSGNSPFTTPAIYAATVRITYQGDERTYTDTVEIVP